jgi:hypothetical protein
MTPAKMADKSLNPIGVSLLGADAVVFETNLPPHLIQQAPPRRSAFFAQTF